MNRGKTWYEWILNWCNQSGRDHEGDSINERSRFYSNSSDFFTLWAKLVRISSASSYQAAFDPHVSLKLQPIYISSWLNSNLINPLTLGGDKLKRVSSISSTSLSPNMLACVGVLENQLNLIKKFAISASDSNESVVWPRQFRGTTSLSSIMWTPGHPYWKYNKTYEIESSVESKKSSAKKPQIPTTHYFLLSIEGSLSIFFVSQIARTPPGKNL